MTCCKDKDLKLIAVKDRKPCCDAKAGKIPLRERRYCRQWQGRKGLPHGKR
jgi:hypothetical protein